MAVSRRRGVLLIEPDINPATRRFSLPAIANYPPVLAGISLTFTSNGDEAIDVARAIRRASPATTIVFGGTAPSEDPGSFWDSAADLICYRNGDAAFAALAAEIREVGQAPAR